jgi:RNA-directed DNA polymerase
VVASFDEISQEWMVRFLEHRIGDRRIIRLIQKWLKAGVLEEGVVTVSDRGTGQGSVISPLLANIYLHYALDLWAERWRRREATGDMIIVRYADDFIIGFQHERDAQRFMDELRKRLGEFALSLHPEKTRLIEFGRFAAERRKRRGLGKPDTFNFVGFTFICGKPARANSRSSGRPEGIACGRSCGSSRRRCGGACTSRSPNKGNGWGGSSAATSTTTPCRPTDKHWPRSGTMSPTSGGARCGVVARRTGARGHG